MAVITVNGWFRVPQATVTNNGELLIAESLFRVLCPPCCLSHRAGEADSLQGAGVSREWPGGIAGSAEALLQPVESKIGRLEMPPGHRKSATSCFNSCKG